MSFLLNAVADRPQALYMLDDDSPFQDYSGYNRTGTVSGGTPVKHLPLTKGALYSQVFDRTIIGAYATPVFNQGFEDRPFSLEASVAPVNRSEGNEPRPYRENLVLNPSFENATDFAYWGQSAGTRSIVTEGGRGRVAESVLQSTGTTNIEAQSINRPISPGQTVNIAADIKLISGAPRVRVFVWFNGIGVGSEYQSITSTDWKRFTFSVTAPDTAASVVYVRFAVVDPPATLRIDNVQVDIDRELGEYFDGRDSGYEWSGTAHASSSRTIKKVSKVNQINNPNADGGLSWVSTSDARLSVAVSSDFAWRSANSFKVGWAGATLTNNSQIRHTGVYFPSETSVTFKFRYYHPSSNTGTQRDYFAVTFRDDIIATNYTSQTVYFDSAPVDDEWQELEVTHVVPADRTLTSVYFRTYFDNPAQTDVYYFDGFQTNDGEYFDGDSAGAEWAGLARSSASYMLVSNEEQQILGNLNQMDGLTINGSVVSFVTKYADGSEARASYDLGENQKAHIIGSHTSEKNSLFVNGEVVSEVQITEAQQASTYVTTSASLSTGATSSSQGVAVNGLAAYDYALSGEGAMRHYLESIIDDEVVAQFDGDEIPLSIETADVYLDELWDTAEDWNAAELRGVSVIDDALVPQFNGSVSVAGQWLDTVPIYVADNTSIYGLSVSWEGQGATVEISADGSSWETVISGRRTTTIPVGYNPTGKKIQLRVRFAGGITNDPSYIRNLRVVALRTGVSQVVAGRTVTYTKAIPQFERIPQELHSDWGVRLEDSTHSLAVSADTVESTPLRTLEVWIKRTSSTAPVISVSGTQYINGVASAAALEVGHWTLLHIVLAADNTTGFTITGPAQVGQVGIYDTALTAADIAAIHNAYFGANVLRVVDTSVVTVSEQANAAQIYAHDWTIQGAG